jgi:hypothetical protein
MLLDRALINLEPVSLFVDGNAIGVSQDQLPPWPVQVSGRHALGSSFGRFGPRWDHFEEVPETFSLLRMVQVTSHYLHSV